MNNKCKYFRRRTKTISKKRMVYLYCTKNRKEIQYSNCKNCPYKEYKEYKKLESKSTIKQKTNQLSKLERNRKSLFTDDLEHCIICGKKKEHLHEVYSGAYRIRSIKEHMVLPLCSFHHRQIHEDMTLNLYWKRSCQKLFEESHSRDEFITIFGRSYL